MFKIFIGLSIILLLTSQHVRAQTEMSQCKRISAAIDEGYKSVSIGGICLWQHVDKIEGTQTWYHSSKWQIDRFSIIGEEIVATNPISLYIINDGNKKTFDMHFVTTEFMPIDSEVKVWHTGMDKGVTFFEGEFINLDQLSSAFVTLNDQKISLLRDMAEADEAIMRFSIRDITLTNDIKTAIKEMVTVWEKHRHELK